MTQEHVASEMSEFAPRGPQSVFNADASTFCSGDGPSSASGAAPQPAEACRNQHPIESGLSTFLHSFTHLRPQTQNHTSTSLVTGRLGTSGAKQRQCRTADGGGWGM